MAEVSVERLAEVFVEAADTLVDQFDLIDFLTRVTDRTNEILNSRAAGLLLADQNGQLRFMAASDESARVLEMFQLQRDQGPCVDAYRGGAPVINADLAEATSTWPAFAPRAVEAGFRSVHAFPLRLRNRVIGVLNVFGSEPSELGETDAQLVQALADIATIGLLQERAVHRAEVLAEQLQIALNSRVSIEQAKGALAEMRDVGVDEAFELIRSFSRSQQRTIDDVARAVLGDPASVPTLTQTVGD